MAKRDLLKALNQSSILNVIKTHGPIARADIARMTALSPAAVTLQTAELIDLGLIIEKEEGDSRGGRRPILLALNADSFHVLGVYPYVGLLRTGVVDEPLRVIDRCRIRWGTVVELTGDQAVVRCQPLVWDGRRLELGAAVLEPVTVRSAGWALTRPLSVGDWCSLHWDWVCDRLSASQVRRLRAYTLRSLTAVGCAPATVLA